MTRAPIPLHAVAGGTGRVSIRPAPREGHPRMLSVLVVAALGVALASFNPLSPTATPRPSVATSAGMPLSVWGPLSRALGGGEPAYRASVADGQLVARNPRQHLTGRFSDRGLTIRSGSLVLGLRLRGYGYGAQLTAAGSGAATVDGDRITYRHGSMTEWYVNGPAGLEQGFTLANPPSQAHTGPLTIAIKLSGNARAALAATGGALTFSRGASSLAYRGLSVTDASGRVLPAWLQLRSGKLLIRVDDAGAAYPITIDPFVQQAKLTGSDGPGGFLGASVAVSGNTLVAGAPLTTVNGHLHEGAVFVFVKPKTGWAHATEVAELTASDATTGSQFGGNNFGPPFAGSSAVAISGNTIVVSTTQTAFGGAYVFVKPASGWHNATETARLTAASGDPLVSVAVSGDTTVAGAPFSSVAAGAAYVFVKPSTGWANATETAQLTSSDGAGGDAFGDAVAVSGGTVVVGAPLASAGGGPGAAYVFTEPSGGWHSEMESAKLTASDGVTGAELGYSVAVSGPTVIAGANDLAISPQQGPGAAYVFAEPSAGWSTENETAKLTASDGAPGDAFGYQVAMQGNTAVAGAPFAQVANHSEQGAAYVFTEPATGWMTATQTGRLTASDGAANDVFGTGLGMTGATIAVGAPGASIRHHAGQGATYVFR